MKFKNCLPLLMLLSFLFIACNRADMYELAKNGPGMIYAFAYDGSNYSFVIAAGDDFYQEYPVSTAFTPDEMHINERGQVLVWADAMTSYYLSDSSYSE